MAGSDDDRTRKESDSPSTGSDRPPVAPPSIPAPPVVGPSAPAWPAPGSAGPVWQWAPPEEPHGPTVGGLIGGAIRLYRQAFGSLFGLALVQQAIQLVLWIPSLLIATRAFNGMIDLFQSTTFFPRTDSYDDMTAFQEQFQAQMQAALNPDPGLAALGAVASGVGVPVGLIFLALFTAVGLATHDGRSDSASAAIRAVSSRLMSFLVPGVLLGLGVVILSLPYGFNQTAFSGLGRTSEGARLGLLLSGLSFIIVIVVIYFAIRWSLAIPAMLAEGIGVRAGLRRSSELTQGMRLRLFGAALLVGVVFLVVELVGLLIALIVGFSIESIAVGVATGAVLLLALIVAVAPIFPAITVVAYRDRVPTEAGAFAPLEAQPALPG
jgi:Membrane domain of glycerophosphoryl diester phosphodiesterase